MLGWYISGTIPDLLIQPIHWVKEAEPVTSANALRISQSRLNLITNPLNREKECIITVYPVSFHLVFCGEHFLQHEVASKKVTLATLDIKPQNEGKGNQNKTKEP